MYDRLVSLVALYDRRLGTDTTIVLEPFMHVRLQTNVSSFAPASVVVPHWFSCVGLAIEWLKAETSGDK